MNDERIDDLQINGLRLIQYPDGYCFTTDSVLLANFAGGYCRTKTVADLGAGGGIIAVLLAGKYGAKSVTGVEIQQKYADLAVKNAELNGLSGKIKIINCPMQEAHKVIGYNKFDAVVSNPPFERKPSAVTPAAVILSTALAERSERVDLSTTNPPIITPVIDAAPDICRQELAVTLAEVAASAARLLKFGSKFFMVHKPERLAEIFAALYNVKLEPKRIRFVCGTAEKKPELVLIEAQSGAKPGLTVEHNLILRQSDGTETQEVRKIYSRV